MATKIYEYIPDENIRGVLIEKFYKESKITLWTKNCVICFEPKTSTYTGHVHRNNTIIIAGFCSEHSSDRYSKLFYGGCEGCFGAYNHRMGIKE